MKFINDTYNSPSKPIPPAIEMCEGILTGLLEDLSVRYKSLNSIYPFGLYIYNLRRKDGMNSCINMYDIRLTDSVPACGLNWPYDLVDIKNYLRVCSCRYFEMLPAMTLLL